MSLLPKGLSEKSSDSGGSNCGGSGNNSDNSALISIGNTSFGFNFDSEEGTMNNSPRNSNSNSEEGDSDEGPGKPKSRVPPKSKAGTMTTNIHSAKLETVISPAKVSSGSDASTTNTSTHNDAAAEAVASLQSIANEANKACENDSSGKQNFKRKAQGSVDNDSGGYNSDDESKNTQGRLASCQDDTASRSADSDSGGQKGSRKKKRLGDMKREERNAREKERSFRISRQINELRSLLSSGGVIVPKGTKSSVLTEAANYIRMLQQHQYRSEIDRHQLVQQIQMIGGGALGQPAATAVRHVAAQNGVWSLGNFGGVPPKSAMMYHQPALASGVSSDPNVQQQQTAPSDGAVLPNKLEDPDYRYVFNSSTVGMAIASMGGAFIDCNKLFCKLSEYTKQEVCSMTIFNITARQDLQHAFDLISQMLSSPGDSSGMAASNSCILRGALKNRNDLGLCVTLIKGDDGIAKCFCVTLVVNPTSPYDSSRPTPATIEHVQGNVTLQTEKNLQSAGLDQAPAYTTG
mmetsp:Transcript_65882/g.129627  ORF Transcript_65882/g.129627 Transcript_65882/m.129627 type:complete len:519 (-) Transcript_65882:11-1567(-)